MTPASGYDRRQAVLAALVIAGVGVGLLAPVLLGPTAAADWISAAAFTAVTIAIAVVFQATPRMKAVVWPTLALGAVVVAARVVSALGGEPGWGFLALTVALFFVWLSLVVLRTRGLLERERPPS